MALSKKFRFRLSSVASALCIIIAVSLLYRWADYILLDVLGLRRHVAITVWSNDERLVCSREGRLVMCELRNFCVQTDARGTLIGAFGVEAPRCSGKEREDCQWMFDQIKLRHDFLEYARPNVNMSKSKPKWVRGGTIIPSVNKFAEHNIYHQAQGVVGAVEGFLAARDRHRRSYKRILFPQNTFFGSAYPGEGSDPRQGYGYDMIRSVLGEGTPENLEIDLLSRFLGLRNVDRAPVCFDRVLFPEPMSQVLFNGFMDCPVSVEVMHDDSACRPSVPSGALWFREAARQALTGRQRSLPLSTPLKGSPPPKRIAFLARDHHRFLNQPDEVVDMLSGMAAARGFEFSIIRNSGDWAEQVERISRQGLVVSVHGANLVNTIYMPLGGYLIEIHPAQFEDEAMLMYWRGSNSGLHYMHIDSVQVPQHEEVGPGHLYSSPQECIAKSRECLRFYRNSNVTVDVNDLQFLVSMALDGIDKYHNGYTLHPLTQRTTTAFYTPGYLLRPSA